MLTVKHQIKIVSDMQYEIVGSYSDKRIAHGKTTAADTFDSLLQEYIDYSQENCTFSTDFVINGIIVAHIEIA